MQDGTTHASLDEVILYLTENEAKQLRDFLDCLIRDKTEPGNHIHVSEISDEMNIVMREITVCLYDTGNEEIMAMFSEDARKFILEDDENESHWWIKRGLRAHSNGNNV
jgi:hypothetical protein